MFLSFSTGNLLIKISLLKLYLKDVGFGFYVFLAGNSMVAALANLASVYSLVKRFRMSGLRTSGVEE